MFSSKYNKSIAVRTSECALDDIKIRDVTEEIRCTRGIRVLGWCTSILRLSCSSLSISVEYICAVCTVREGYFDHLAGARGWHWAIVLAHCVFGSRKILDYLREKRESEDGSPGDGGRSF